MTGIDELEKGTALEARTSEEDSEEVYVDPHGDYAIARAAVVDILQRLTGSKVNALEVLTRLEEALLATALLYTPDAAKARESFGVGLAVFCKDLD